MVGAGVAVQTPAPPRRPPTRAHAHRVIDWAQAADGERAHHLDEVHHDRADHDEVAQVLTRGPEALLRGRQPARHDVRRRQQHARRNHLAQEAQHRGVRAGLW